ncbi:MAG: SPFH domain-containing protein [Phycisphaerales bacterium]|jgi:membrane protease subunit (stomatin/prohibitin family)|nr:SPFH domain-containing protein [Phycisphaerales bacterium]
MGIWDKLRGELIDIIEWLDESRDTMVYRFPRYENEIKYGAKLVVREGQAAAFVNEGKLADVFQPGTYTLETQNLPILATLKGWKYGFNSPFKAEVYFVSTRVFTDRKWGTKNPIMLRDAEFGPVRLRAFGSYAVRVSDPAAFLREIVGTDSRFTIDEFGEQLRDMVVSRFTDVLGESKIPALDLASNYDELAKYVAPRIAPDFASFGLELNKFLVENISLPAEVEAAMDKRTSMGVIGNMQQYAQYQSANAIGDAAKNPGGLAGAGVGLGAGYMMAQQFGQAINPANPPNPPANAPAAGPPTAGPPPIPSAIAYFIVLDGQQAGPFDLGKLRENVSAGKLSRQTLVWKQGMAQWTAAGDLAELASLFASAPPPIPKNS